MASKEELKLYDTLTQQKEIFKPLEPEKVSMYVCGVTAYDFSHLGHARATISFDVLFRYLKYLGYEVTYVRNFADVDDKIPEYLGYEVTYVRNFTDVDDKIIRRANETGEDPLSLSNRFCQEYLTDMDDLQCLCPTHEPRVSDHMDQIKDMITQIINNDCAYVVDGDFFLLLKKPWIMGSYPDKDWKIIELGSVLLWIQGSVILLTLHCVSSSRLQRLVSQVGKAHGVVEGQDGT